MAKITIYSTATCGYCKMLKSYLQSRKIDYTEKHADRDKAAADELYEMSGQLGVPFTVIEQKDGSSEGFIGFDRMTIDAALGL